MRLPFALMLLAACASAPDAADWQPLFPQDGVPVGWRVSAWKDLALAPPEGSHWAVEDGVLTSRGARGTWLVSEAEYGDLELEYEFRLGPRGNSGLALRSPAAGDPAFDGLELQMADLRYNLEAKPSELTGGLYRAVAPYQQVYLPEQWNRMQVRLEGAHIQARLNGTVILDHDLSAERAEIPRHDGTMASPLRDRPRLGHIGFQELSRGGDHVLIRGARLRVLD
ncbi:MAG: DUF1080 domain-containing protein [Planctomycetota bacterium]|nr:DUF1080 domain-containing protein [Planctomycetota bacterium]